MDEKERNYCCLVLLLNRVGLVKLRHFFIYQWDSCSGCLPWTDSLQNGAALLIKYTPLYYERDKVKSGDTTTWDLSLFVKTLLYSTPPLVPSYETALVDGLKYLKDTRDLLCHTQNGKIESSTRFQDLFKDACNALKLLGASKNDFTRVENDVQQPWIKVLSMVKVCTSQDAEILQGIDTIKSNLDAMKTDLYNVHHRQEQSQIIQEEMLLELKRDQWKRQETTKQILSVMQQNHEEMNRQLMQIQNRDSSDLSCQKQKKIKKDLSLITRAKEKLKQRIERQANPPCMYVPMIVESSLLNDLPRSSSPQPLSQELSNQVYPWPADLLLKSIPHDLRFAIEIRISNPKRPGWRELAQELLFDEETILCIDNHNQPEKGYLLFEVLNTQKPKLTFTAFVDVLAMLKRVDVVEKSKDYYRDNNDVNNVTLEDS